MQNVAPVTANMLDAMSVDELQDLCNSLQEEILKTRAYRDEVKVKLLAKRQSEAVRERVASMSDSERVETLAALNELAQKKSDDDGADEEGSK